MKLIENCKRAIDEGRCLGCVGLEDKNYPGNPNCQYSKIPTAKESIDKIKSSLRINNRRQ